MEKEKCDINLSYIELYNGHKMPRLCYGTWQIPNGDVAYKAAQDALAAGYRHIDTAFDYGNEKSVGKAIRESGISREEIFVTTKLSANIKNYKEAKNAIRQSLDNLGLEYVDQYIIHAPWPWTEIGKNYDAANAEIYGTMEDAVNEGKFRNIGLSNFNVSDIQNILDTCTINPTVNQIKLHVGNYPRTLVEYCNKNGLAIMGYSTLGTKSIVNKPSIKEIADRYQVSTAQLCIRYSLQHGAAPIVLSLNPEHMKENRQVDFCISDEDMEQLDKLPGMHSDFRLPYEE
ncbi:MAG: aldo/keto reductase [Candidatus Azobacteroides sp.]|nr:aldo/keto reductase [Candidatus Azobacteroides sp.]